WTSSDPSIADIGTKAPKKGVLMSKAVGRITVSAVEPVSGVSTTASGGDGIITIVDGLQAVRVLAGNLQLRTGATFKLHATGIYPNPMSGAGEPATVEIDITNSVEFVSNDPSVVRVDKGVVVAVGLGETTVSARDPKTGIVSSQSNGDATFRVTAALARLKIT